MFLMERRIPGTPALFSFSESPASSQCLVRTSKLRENHALLQIVRWRIKVEIIRERNVAWKAGLIYKTDVREVNERVRAHFPEPLMCQRRRGKFAPAGLLTHRRFRSVSGAEGSGVYVVVNHRPSGCEVTPSGNLIS
jgi:hypothetical protein